MAVTSATPVGETEIDRGQRVLLFANLFAVYVLVHEALDAHKIVGRDLPRNLADLAVVVTSIGFLSRRRSWSWFTGLMGALVVQKLIQMPRMPNHVLFTFFLVVMLLGVLVVHRLSASGRPWWDFMADVGGPALRASMVAIYAVAALHKLNVDYVDIAVSCGALAGRGVRVGGLEDVALLNTIAVFGSLLVEAGLAIGLVVRRTRMTALVIGLGFHLVLGIPANTAVTSFSLLVVPLYVLFVPLGVLDRMAERLASRPVVTRLRTLPPLVLGLAAASPLVLGAVVQHSIVGRIAAIAIVAGALVLLVWTIASEPRLLFASDAERRRPVGTAVAVGLLAVLLVNAASPYVGFKTQTSFAMYSNLRTEGGESNHLFLPSLSLVSDDAERLVQVVDSSSDRLRFLVDSGDHIPFFELRRFAWTEDADDLRLVYRDVATGEVVRAERGGVTDPAGAGIFEDVSLLEHKTRGFRPIDPLDEPQTCRH